MGVLRRERERTKLLINLTGGEIQKQKQISSPSPPLFFIFYFLFFIYYFLFFIFYLFIIIIFYLFIFLFLFFYLFFIFCFEFIFHYRSLLEPHSLVQRLHQPHWRAQYPRQLEFGATPPRHPL